MSPIALRTALMWLVSVDFGDDPSVPDRVEQIVLADDVLAVLDQMDEQVEDLRPDRDGPRSPGEFPPVKVEQIIFEQELHGGTPSPLARTPGRTG